MKYAIISDTHGKLDNFQSLLDWLKKNNINSIIHLGDNYEDTFLPLNNGFNVIRVPGIFCSSYFDQNVPNRIFKNIFGWEFFISHTIKSTPNDDYEDHKPEKIIEDANTDVFLYGHTHVPDLKIKSDILFVNPGHLQNDDQRGFDPSFAVMEINENILSVVIFDFRSKKIIKEIKHEKNSQKLNLI